VLYSSKKIQLIYGGLMKLHEELYFEITVEGAKSDARKFISYLLSGELDEFMEFSSDFILYEGDYNSAADSEKVIFTLANDDFGIEIDEFNPEDFLDALCRAGKDLFIHGNIYDIDDEEYRFISNAGDAYYSDATKIDYIDELDEEARREEIEDELDD